MLPDDQPLGLQAGRFPRSQHDYLGAGDEHRFRAGLDVRHRRVCRNGDMDRSAWEDHGDRFLSAVRADAFDRRVRHHMRSARNACHGRIRHHMFPGAVHLRKTLAGSTQRSCEDMDLRRDVGPIRLRDNGRSDERILRHFIERRVRETIETRLWS